MTTRIRIANEGPGRVRVTARGDEPIDAPPDASAGPPMVLAPGESADFLHVWAGRKFLVEEIPADES